MITVSVMELWPEGPMDATMVHHLMLFAAGGALTFLICKLASCLESQGNPADGESGEQDLSVKAVERRSWRLAVLLFISLTAHNLPEGLAVAIPTLDATKSKCMAISVALLSGMTETLGAVVAILVLQPYLTANVIEELLIFVAGIMCYIAFFELLPESVRGGGMLYVVACIGLAVGAAIMILTHLLLEQAMHDDHDHDGHDHDHHHHHH